MDKEKVLLEIHKVAVEKEGKLRLTCTDARRIAEKLKISYAEMGKLCNDEKIKIHHCELGCF
ncbi:MAG: hypothetical protein V2A54_17000 [Bacteroidota bacterium]